MCPLEAPMPRSPYLRLGSVLSGSSQGELRRLIHLLKARNEVLPARIEACDPEARLPPHT